jgi:hypothetical protein
MGRKESEAIDKRNAAVMKLMLERDTAVALLRRYLDTASDPLGAAKLAPLDEKAHAFLKKLDK